MGDELTARRAKPIRTPHAKIRPGKPAPTMGPGMGKGSEMAFTNKSNPAKFTFSPKAMPPGKGGTCPGKPLLKTTVADMLAPLDHPAHRFG